MGLWSLHDGNRLLVSRLHGAVRHIVLVDRTLHAATELGRYMSWDLDMLYRDYCALLTDVWKDTPLVWRNGRPHAEAPPDGHRCASDG